MKKTTFTKEHEQMKWGIKK